MSDESDIEEELASDIDESLVHQESDESETDQDSDESDTERGEGFLDLEAEDEDEVSDDSNHSDSYDSEEERGSWRRQYATSEQFYFPQFSRLPPEIRAMIWESFDPDLKSQGRVFDFYIVTGELWEYPFMEEQTAPARALLATNKESRHLALKHYPDVIRLRGHRGHIRFNSANDVVVLHLRYAFNTEVFNISSWCDKLKYIALDFPVDGFRDYQDVFSRLPQTLSKCNKNLEAIFLPCYRPSKAFLGIAKLGWCVSESAKRFCREAFEEGKVIQYLYCWPNNALHANFADLVGEGYLRRKGVPSEINSIPVWPMFMQTTVLGRDGFDIQIKKWHELRAAEKASNTAVPSSPSSSSESSSEDESETDDYDIDGFVVDDSDENEESGDDEEPSHVGFDEEDDVSDGDSEVFNGFSPLQEENSGTEGTGDVPEAAFSSLEPESPRDHVSDASSPEEQHRTAKQSGRFKYQVVSSDDEDDEDDGGGGASNTKGDLRVNKRSRAVFLDSEDDEDEDGSGDGDGGSNTKGHSRVNRRSRVVIPDSEDDDADGPVADTGTHSRVNKRSRVVLSDSEDDDIDGLISDKRSHSRQKKRVRVILSDDDEDEEDVRNRDIAYQQPSKDLEEEKEEEDDDDDEDEEEVGEQERPRVKPLSLFAKLRQFRSDVPVSPERESPDLDADKDMEGDEDNDDEEHRFSDAEFPESAEEDGW